MRQGRPGGRPVLAALGGTVAGNAWADFAGDGKLVNDQNASPSEAGQTWNSALAAPLRVDGDLGGGITRFFDDLQSDFAVVLGVVGQDLLVRVALAVVVGVDEGAEDACAAHGRQSWAGRRPLASAASRDGKTSRRAAVIERAALGGQAALTRVHEYRVARPDGTLRWVAARLPREPAA